MAALYIDELLSDFNAEEYPLFTDNIVIGGVAYTPNDIGLYIMLLSKIHNLDYTRVKSTHIKDVSNGEITIPLDKGCYDFFESIEFKDVLPNKISLVYKDDIYLTIYDSNSNLYCV